LPNSLRKRSFKQITCLNYQFGTLDIIGINLVQL